MESHRGLWWKRKYLQLKTVKELSEKLLCVLLVHLTEL
ncbi:nef attachable domain protein [Chlamydia psittaci 02DC14]|nr:nef attachable domain protein [Chlamydia psittaci 02DC21]EPL01928.1 nef attachable domain protein [Chlamydia psittaci 02DC14]